MSKSTDKQPAEGQKHKLLVQGPERGRWRLGMKFGREATAVELTEAEFKIIQADPLLKILGPAGEKA